MVWKQEFAFFKWANSKIPLSEYIFYYENYKITSTAALRSVSFAFITRSADLSTRPLSFPLFCRLGVPICKLWSTFAWRPRHLQSTPWRVPAKFQSRLVERWFLKTSIGSVFDLQKLVKNCEDFESYRPSPTLKTCRSNFTGKISFRWRSQATAGSVYGAQDWCFLARENSKSLNNQLIRNNTWVSVELRHHFGIFQVGRLSFLKLAPRVLSFRSKYTKLITFQGYRWCIYATRSPIYWDKIKIKNTGRTSELWSQGKRKRTATSKVPNVFTVHISGHLVEADRNFGHRNVNLTQLCWKRIKPITKENFLAAQIKWSRLALLEKDIFHSYWIN